MGKLAMAWSAVKLNLAMQMIYRLDFILNVFVMMLFNFTFPFLTLLIYSNSPGFPGWNASQILLFQGFAILVWGLEQMFLGNVSWELNRLIREGQLDRLLVNPSGPLFYLGATQLSLEMIPQVLLGVGIIIIAFFKLGLFPSLLAWLLLLLFLACGLLMMISLSIIQMAMVIRFVQIRRIGELTRIASLLGQYPANIYSKWLQAIVVGAVPFALIAFFPASVVLGKLENFPYTAVIAAALFGVLAWLSWRSSLGKYTSAGG
ncbi:MAG: hypothetical protein EPN86_02445 [Nanoarchaeota archaeon]|nr:MAG: hypothetical protein EPN86_02445 [Nanoarchaeota archaeon]